MAEVRFVNANTFNWKYVTGKDYTMHAPAPIMIEDGLQKSLMWSSVLHKSSLGRCSVKLRCNQRRWTRWCAIGAALDSGYSSEFDRGAVQMVGSWCGSAGSSCHNKEVIRVDPQLTIPTGKGHFVWWWSSEDYFKLYSRCFLILVQIQWSSWSLMHIVSSEQAWQLWQK